MNTWAAKRQEEMVECGYSFKKHDDGYWECRDEEGTLIETHRQLGKLISLMASSLGID
ncbi:hypothetical protein TQVEPAJM_CDS0074 [Pseudomonas phage VB_PaN_phPA-Intesti]|uniref:Uncharacterized protein n=1 Tax=Pseudomonas phage PAP-JP TaxID=2583508 RepID=A0A5C1K4N8_9CAUD|nr:hypothetical protein PAPJP_075 [Pseudomonas phage PAP-JP]